jgi:hypothetical protein
MTYQVVENTFIELPLCRSALPELLVIVVETGPVFAEFSEAVLIHVFDAVSIDLSACHLFKYLLFCALPGLPHIHTLQPSSYHPHRKYTHTLLAHLVTLLPSFKHSISPFPALSFLHIIKSSLIALHLAPIKKLADSNGAELLPISVTAGMDSGRGVVSMRVVWLNLYIHFVISNCNWSEDR